ncbi:hypothetical protein [Cetobacterium sp.]|uniref:hypothetical protein n=1 Tax=Cetobacterium sp. TaxID=2071632 RepID=UPI003F3735B1
MKATAYVILSREDGENFGVIDIVFDKEKALEVAKNSIKVLIDDSWNSENIDLAKSYKTLEVYNEVYEEGAGEVQIIERIIDIPGNLAIASRILR